MTEALSAVIAYLFTAVDMHRIQAKYNVNNPASGRVMQKEGMSFGGTLREERIGKDKEYYDLNICSILQDEWKAAGQGR